MLFVVDSPSSTTRAFFVVWLLSSPPLSRLWGSTTATDDVEYAASGNGLTNMRNRMADCGGNCTIESVRGQGTTITLTLPLPS